MSQEDINDIIDQFSNIPVQRRIIIEDPNRRQPRMAQPSIRDYMDTIPPFNGDPILISNFILACENVIHILGRPDDDNFNSFLVAHIRSKLVGRAAQLISVRNLKSWTDVKQAILFTFSDQRDEDALMRDLIMLKQENNESSLRFGEKCQDTLSLLLSKINSSSIGPELKEEKIKMYKNLAVKTFMKGVKEPYSLIVRCRNPQTIEEAIGIVSEENNLNYIRKISQNPNHSNIFSGTNRGPQINQMPRSFPLPTYNARPTITPNRPIFNQQHSGNRQAFNQQNPVNRPYQWPSRPNYWQQQTFNRNPSTAIQNFRPQQNFRNPIQNSSIQRRQPQNYPIPMDTSSGNTPAQRNHFQRNNPQRPNFIFEELHYSNINQDGYPNDELPVEQQEQYEPNTYYPQQNYDFYDENYDEYIEPEYTHEPEESTPVITEPESQDFIETPPTKIKK